MNVASNPPDRAFQRAGLTRLTHSGSHRPSQCPSAIRRTTHALPWVVVESDRVRPAGPARTQRHQGWAASPRSWPTRASSRSLSTTSCGSRFSSKGSAITPCCRRTSVRWAQWSASMSSWERPPNGASGPTTEWRVRPDHHARRVLDVLDRCHSPDVRHALLPGITVGSFFNRPGGAERGAPASVSRSSTRRPFTSTASWRADTDICRWSAALSSTSTNVTRRITAVVCSSLQLGPDAPGRPLSDRLRGARGAGQCSGSSLRM